MTIILESSDIKCIAKKVSEILNTNKETRHTLTTKVERFGIPLKISISRECNEYNDDYSYVIDEIEFYGVNSKNVFISIDYHYLEFYGTIPISW